MALLKDTVITGDLSTTGNTGSSSYSINDLKIFYGTCDTAAATTAKVVVCPEFTASNLVAGTLIVVKFSATNSGAVGSITMNVNSTGAKNIKKIYNAAVSNLVAAGEIIAGISYMFSYNGTYWVLVSGLDYNSTGTVNQAAVITTNGEYCLLHANDTGTAAKNGAAVYKSAATINPSTGQITMKGKPVLYGEYAASTAPSSPVSGQIWFKQATMTVEEAKVLVVSATASSLPTTISNANIKSDMVVIKHEIGNPSLVSGSLSFAMSAGSATISGSLSGSTTITLYLQRSR
jgi:hypothetical protein